jgi:signal transduction histidine kinase
MDDPEAPAEILVVDDDPDVRAAFVDILRSAGWTVRQVGDGSACLEAIGEHVPALVLLDVQMPGIDGIETLQRLRERGYTDLPVLLLTGRRLDPESIGSGLVMGADEYLPKPVAPGELTARIRATLHLAAARRELEALKRDHAAMLVHDLKQPLAIIALRAEFIAEVADDPELLRSGQAIREACRQMEQLIHSVLEMSRVEAGQLRLSRARWPFDLLLDGVVEPLRGLAERRGILLSVQSAATGLAVEIDRPKVEQVLQNLVGNALKFTPTGGTIEITCAKQGGELTIAVEDSGCGIPAGEAGRVFDKWHQTQVGRARGGSGLGLAIARAIVEAHGGRIGAGPRLDGGRGARFWFVLPAQEAAATHAAM